MLPFGAVLLSLLRFVRCSTTRHFGAESLGLALSSSSVAVYGRATPTASSLFRLATTTMRLNDSFLLFLAHLRRRAIEILRRRRERIGQPLNQQVVGGLKSRELLGGVGRVRDVRVNSFGLASKRLTQFVLRGVDAHTQHLARIIRVWHY